MNRLLISAAHKSSGKTTISIGLCAALSARNLKVQPFKKGPDYIDPMWLGCASGRACHNLDFYTMSEEEILACVHRYASGADLALIEGNKGLYDGLDLDGSNSNAALASYLDVPVLLVIDVRGMTRGIAPLILGYQAFDAKIKIAGVILNQVGGSRHEGKLQAVIEHYTDVPVVGAVHHQEGLNISERHLGLMPSNENRESDTKIAAIGKVIAEQVDIDKVLAIAANTSPLSIEPITTTIQKHTKDIRIGIARDAAFGFYYPGDLQAFADAGAELVSINTLRDKKLPDIDGLFIGGGFPETSMVVLEANTSLRKEIKEAIDTGLPVYAECGGLMYLAKTLTWQGRQCEMVGAIPGDTVMHAKPQGRGYVRLQETGQSLWPESTDPSQKEIAAHEFHYSSIENLQHPINFAYKVLRGAGVDGQHDGIIYKNMLACYVHLRNTAQNRWVERFVNFVRNYKQTTSSNITTGQ